jgi:hypothetical protein
MIWALRLRCVRPKALWPPKNTQWCWGLFSVMLRPLLLTFFTICNFCKLLFIIEGSVLVIFLLLVTFINYLFYCSKGPGELFTYIFSLFRGRGCALIFYFLLFTIEGEGEGGGGWFFFPFIWNVEGGGERG